MKALSDHSDQRNALPNQERPTQRAADGGYVPRFRAGFWLEAFPYPEPIQPLPPPLTLTVGLPASKTGEEMNITVYKVLRSTSALLFVYINITGVSALIPRGSADFQCWARYDEANKCVDDHQAGSLYQIEAFLSTYRVGWENGGCNYKHTESSTLDVVTSVKDLRFERDSNDLSVNGKVLKQGSKFQFVEMLNWSPWIISKMEFENIGSVASCNSSSSSKRFLIVGSYGTKISLPKGLTLLAASIGGYIFANKQLKVSKSSSPNTSRYTHG